MTSGDDGRATAPATKPVWNGFRRELWFRGVVVKRLRVPAENQQRVLQAFEELGWPERIPDPLPGRNGVDSSARLRETIRKLNGGQSAPLVRFFADGTGVGILWEPRAVGGAD